MKAVIALLICLVIVNTGAGYWTGKRDGFRQGIALARQNAVYAAGACHEMLDIGINQIGEAEARYLKKLGYQPWHPLELQCNSLDELAKP